MELKPLAGYVLIEPINEEETTVSGLIIPEGAKDKSAKGKIVVAGSPIIYYNAGIFHDEKGNFTPQELCPVKEGDIVIFHRWSGQDVREGQKEYKLVKFSDLIGVYA